MPPISVHKWNTCLCTTPLDCAVHHLAFTLLCKPGGIQKWVYSVYICVGGGGWISSKWECYTGFLHVLHCVVQIQLMLMGSDHLIQAGPEIWKWKVKKLKYLITPSLGLFFLTFFKKICEHMSIFGATDALFQIYGDISSGFHSQSGLPYFHFGGGVRDICFPRFTSGATSLEWHLLTLFLRHWGGIMPLSPVGPRWFKNSLELKPISFVSSSFKYLLQIYPNFQKI